MADPSEFLVSLGYRSRSERDWVDALAKIEKAVDRLAKALAAAASAVAALVGRTSISLDSMNFAAQRTGTSVETLKALAYAYSRAGASGADAVSAVEAFAERMRLYPAVEGLVRQFGAATHRNGALRDYADILLDLVDKLGKTEDYTVAYQQAGLFGLSEQQYWFLRRQAGQIRADREAFVQDARRMGIDLSSGGATSTVLMQTSRQAMMQATMMIDGIAAAVAPILVPLIDRLGTWMTEHRGEIVAAVEWAVDGLSRIIEWAWVLVASLSPVAESFFRFVEVSTGENGLVMALEAVGTAWLVSVMLRMFGVGGRVRAAIVALTAAMVIGDRVIPSAVGMAPVTAGGGQRRGLWGRLWDSIKRSFGIDGTPEAKDKGGMVPPSDPMLDRSSFEEELKDPAVRQRLFAMTEAEVGGYGEADYRAFMETAFNRAKARRQSLWKTLHGSYWARRSHVRMDALMKDPALAEKYRKALEAVKNGSNITNGATGNASGPVGFGGGPLMWRSPHGEGYGVEGQDMQWWRREQDELKKRDQHLDETLRKTPWGLPLDRVSSNPLTTSMGADSFSVAANKVTRIVVKGDTDPHRTAQDVTAAQRRTNTDLITSTNRAFA